MSSALEPIASDPIQTIPSEIVQPELPFLKFPPFPEPPPGVTIMPFRDFKPRGIQLFSEAGAGTGNQGETNGRGGEDDVELDALGIPTIELRVKHVTDESKSEPRKKRKKKKAAAIATADSAATEAAPVKRLPWYEEWEEGEDLRVTRVRYDAVVPAVDRFFEAAFDFRTGRPWPPLSSNLNHIWDQFRLFTGLLINPSMYRKASARKNARADSPDFESDDEEDPARDTEDGALASDLRPAKRQRQGEGLNGDDETAPDDPQKPDEELKEEKISNFLNNPEKAVRIFLSSYMREQGLIWAERNLIYTPHLIYFFLAFVLRNRVLSEPVYQRRLKQALETIKWAKKELPLTHKVGQSIPDAFNEACRECFGRKGGINWSSVNATTTATEQKDPGITVTDISTGVERNVSLPTELQIQLKDAIEDNVDTEVSLDTSFTNVAPINKDVTDEDGWGEGWGNEGSWDQNAWAKGDPWGDQGQGTNGTTVVDHEVDAQWADSDPTWRREPASLFSLLGPSTLPLTHTTGIIECSTRRVVAIQFPPGHPKGESVPSAVSDARTETTPKGCERASWIPLANGVEAELDARFAKVVLEPWGREEGDISAPEIWGTSRGLVVDPKNARKSNVKAPAGLADGTMARRPHDPLKDNIILLVVPSFAETLALVPRLGLAAMWIEIVRRGSGAEEVDVSTPGRFWYHEDVTGIFPSFYTPREKE